MLKNIGKQIKSIRQLKGLTQEELAEKTNLSLTSVSRLENEKSMVSIEKLWCIAQALDTDFGVILCDYINNDVSTKEDSEMLGKFKMLSDERKKSVIAFIDVLFKGL